MSSFACTGRVTALAVALILLLAAGLALAAGPDPLLQNGGFESGAVGWTTTAGQLQIVSDPVRSGSHAGRLAASGGTLISFLESGFITVTAGATYTLTGAVYFTETAIAGAQLRITWYSDTASTALWPPAFSTPVLAPAAAWQGFVPLRATPPAAAHVAKVRAVVSLASLAAAGAAVFDDLDLQGPPLPTPTATAAPTASATETPVPSATPTATPSATPRPVTTAVPGDVLISEVQAHPAAGGSAGEWLELYNRTGAALALSGWSLADNHGADPLPAVSLPAASFLVVAADPAAFGALFSGFAGSLIVVSDGLIGNGLADDGDRLVLYDGAGTAIDALSFGADVSIFDPPAPAVAAGHSLERWRLDVDTDTAADFVDNGSPSPGEPLPPSTPTASATPSRTATASRTPTASASPSPTASATPTWQAGAVRLNEVLPAPHDVDWDGDGVPGSADEWVELYNPAAAAVDLGGWRLDDSSAAATYSIPPGQWVPPGGFLVLYHRQTGVTLNNDGDAVRLFYPDGSLAEQVTYGGAHYDESFSRTAAGSWTWDYPPSPGAPNLPPPTPTPAPTPTDVPVVPISHARGAARGATVAVQGWVTAPSGVFGRRVAYISDGTAGLRLQHYSRDLPPLTEGDLVYVEGRLTTSYGEVTLNVRALTRLGPGRPAPPMALGAGQMGAWWEGTLVRLAGRVVRWDADDIFLSGDGAADSDDGAGMVQVRLRESTGLRRPEMTAGQSLQVTGVVGQSNGVWMILPRWQTDLAGQPPGLPARLPATGE